VITNKIRNETYEKHPNIKFILVSPTLQYEGGMPPSFFDNLRFSFNALKNGVKIIKDKKIDLIHSNNFAPILSGSILSFLTSKPQIITIHDIFSLCGKDYWKKWGQQNNVSKVNVLLAPLFEKWMLRMKHKCIHTVSEASREDLEKFGAKKPIYVIHNSIKKKNSHIETVKDPMQFVYVGRLVFYKNLEVVIKAVKIVQKSEPSIKFVIVGDGPHKSKLEKLVQKLELEPNIKFQGYVNEEKKNEIISTSNALVLPSLCEGFGLVILEAYSENIPVMTSDIRPMSDLVKHESTGYVLNPHDEKAWADCFLKLIKNPHEASLMGQNGKKELITLFSLDSMYQKVLKMYNDVLN